MLTRTVMTRAEAKAAGLKRYYSGTPCKRGHVHSDRYVAGGCVACNRTTQSAWVKNNALAKERRYARDRQGRITPEYKAHRRAVRAERLRDPLERAKYRAARRKSAGLPEPTRPEPDNCENCSRKEVMRLDHCHKTGAFRGWLCNECNNGIGKLGDDLASVLRAAEYLRRFECS